MSIFSKFFGHKVDESVKPQIEACDPQSLPEAFRYIADKWGVNYLQNRGSINVLNDFKVLKDIPAAKHILLNMQSNGYVEKISLAKNWALESKSIASSYASAFGAKDNIVNYIVQCLGYGLQKRTDIPMFVEEQPKETLSFDDPPKEEVVFPPQPISPQRAPQQPYTPPVQPQSPPVQPQNLGPYDPKCDLPNYLYPTYDLLEEHSSPDLVSIKSVLKSSEYQNTTMALPCAIGKKDDGSILMFDLAEAPHLMMSGSSGMGVSVCFNTIITSLLYKKHPAELKFVMVDPKKIEFSFYSSLEKHFLASLPDKDVIVTDMSNVSGIFASLNIELDARLELFKKAAVRDIKSYNRRFCDRKLDINDNHRYLPYIVVLIDEYDELIRCSGTLVQQSLESISRMGRSTGIHLIISVQRPVATVISAGIKTNIPSRISFRVTSSNDSRNIIGVSGAEKLKRPGDMIYTNGYDIINSRCAYIDTIEVDRINDFIISQQGYMSSFELPDPEYVEAEPWVNDIDMQHLDPLFEDAARLIVLNQSGSTSLIQRKFAIGYNRSSRLLDQLEKAGIVGPAMGSTPRDVYVHDVYTLNNILNKLR